MTASEKAYLVPINREFTTRSNAFLFLRLAPHARDYDRPCHGTNPLREIDMLFLSRYLTALFCIDHILGRGPIRKIRTAS